MFGIEAQTHGGNRDYGEAVVTIAFPTTPVSLPPAPLPADTRPPVVTIVSPAAGLVTDQEVSVAGAVTDDAFGVASLQAQVDSGPWSAVGFDPTGHFQFDTTLPLDGTDDGTRTVSLRSTDAAGNTSSPVAV